MQTVVDSTLVVLNTAAAVFGVVNRDKIDNDAKFGVGLWSGLNAACAIQGIFDIVEDIKTIKLIKECEQECALVNGPTDKQRQPVLPVVLPVQSPPAS